MRYIHAYTHSILHGMIYNPNTLLHNEENIALTLQIKSNTRKRNILPEIVDSNRVSMIPKPVPFPYL